MVLCSKVRSFRQKTIRFKRKGRKYYPVYDIVVVFKDRKVSSGSFIEKIGFLNPHSNESQLFVNVESLAFWACKGVYINKTVKKYLKKYLINYE